MPSRLTRTQLDKGECAADGDGVAGECVGRVYGWVGLLRASPGVEGDADFLLLIADSDFVGFHPFTEAPIRLLRRLLALPLDAAPPPPFAIPACPTHAVSLGPAETAEGPPSPQSFSLLQKSGSKLGSKLKGLQPKAKAPAQASANGDAGGDSNRRLIEDVLRLFNEAPSFYFLPTGAPDLTQSVLRLAARLDDAQPWPLLASFDERFMWNMDLVQAAMEGSAGDERWRHWVLGLVQGYVGQKEWNEPSTSKRLGYTHPFVHTAVD